MSSKATLLLVDDDQLVLETFKLWLENEGYEVFTAETREEALKIVEDKPIAICLIDLRIKDDDGLQLSQELSRIDNLLKNIIITGFPSYETAIDAIKGGVFDYISKSSDNSEILEKIDRAIEARETDIASKARKSPKQESIVLVCNHAMIKEGFEQFCREYNEFHLAHTYHSVDYIKSSDFNNTASLALICSSCNQHHLDHPETMLQRLDLFFPNARIVLINCQLVDEKKIKLIKLGIKGFLPQNILKDKMRKAFKTILNGQMWISRYVSQTLLNELMVKTPHTNYNRPSNTYNLSNREVEIIEAIASGLSNVDISDKLFISEKTVKAHINHIFKKMKVKSRTQAVKKAAEEHII